MMCVYHYLWVNVCVCNSNTEDTNLNTEDTQCKYYLLIKDEHSGNRERTYILVHNLQTKMFPIYH